MIAAVLILVLVGLVMYGMDYDLRRLRDELQAEEIGADREDAEGLLADGFLGRPSLTTVGADDYEGVA